MKAEQIKQRLSLNFPEAEIQIIDQTGTEDHWEVHLRTDKLKHLSRINQQRAVMDIFSAELKTGEIHAFTIKIHTKE